MSTLTDEDRTALHALQDALDDASSASWLSPAHKQARQALVDKVRALRDRGVPLAALAGALSVSRQRAHQLLGPDPRSKQPTP